MHKWLSIFEAKSFMKHPRTGEAVFTEGLAELLHTGENVNFKENALRATVFKSIWLIEVFIRDHNTLGKSR
jgi:hypothetical protein